MIIIEKVRVGVWHGRHEGLGRIGPEKVGTWQQTEFLWVKEWEGFVSDEVSEKKWWLYGKRGSLGGQMTKGGVCSHKDEGRNSGLWKKRERICVGI